MARRGRSNLSDDLYETSQKFARTAVVALNEDEHSVFLLHSATALEQLAKAFLATQHPSLLVDRDFDALLHVVGLPQAAKRPPSRMRTVSMETALQRCSLFVPALTRIDRELATLREVRNGLVHLGSQIKSSEVVLDAFLQATDILLSELGASKDVYWGDQYAFVAGRLREAVTSTNEHVQRLVDDSRRAFLRRFQDTETSWKNEVVQITVSAYDLDKLERQLWPCPACESDALTEGHIEPDYEFDEEVDDGEFMVHAELKDLYFYPQRLHCRVCGLRLEGANEIDAAGVLDNWALDSPDVEQVDDWEARWADIDY